MADYMDDISPGTETRIIAGIDSDQDLRDFSGIEEEKKITEQIIQQATSTTGSPETRNPTLFIGLGGTGLQALDTLKYMLVINSDDGKSIPPGIAFTGFDCDVNQINKLKYLQPNTEAFSIPIQNPKDWHKANKDSHWSRFLTQKTFPQNASFGAAQYRQISRMCVMNYFDSIIENIQNALTPILPLGKAGEALHLEAYIVCSICGGAGSGMMIDMAAMLRDFARVNNHELTIYGIFATGDVYQKFKDIKIAAHQRILANTYACIRDLQYIQNKKSDHNQAKGTPLLLDYPNGQIKIDRELFDLVCLVQGSNRYGRPTIVSQEQLNHFLASTMFLMSTTPLGADKKSVWINPKSGHDMTNKFVDGAPRSFSSIGYSKLMYPEKEFVNYMHGLYGEEILKHFMHAVQMKVPAQKQKDPTAIDLGDYIKNYAKKKLQEKDYEFEDIKIDFNQFIKKPEYSQDKLLPSFKTIVENQSWENIQHDIGKEKNRWLEQLEGLKQDVANAQTNIIANFDDFLAKLPDMLVDSYIGVSHMTTLLGSLESFLDIEEAEAAMESEKIKRQITTSHREWADLEKQMDSILADAPLFTFLGKKRIKNLLPFYCKEFSEYLNDRVEELVIEAVIKSYQEFDKRIASWSRLLNKILTKFDQALKLYRRHRIAYEDILKKIAGQKTAYDRHYEFSVLNIKQFYAMRDEFLTKKPPRQVVKALFGSAGTSGVSEFWHYEDARYKSGNIVLYIQDYIGDYFKKFRMSLRDAIRSVNISDTTIKNEINKYVKTCKAQWNVSQHKAQIKPVEESCVAYPEDLKISLGQGNNSPKSTSDRQIEILTIEYAMPAQLITGVPVWKEKYNQESAENDFDGGLHNIPEANGWDDVDVFPGTEDFLLAFALGIAYGHIYELTDAEAKAVKAKYKKQNYCNFIFASANQYFLMPHYKLPPQRTEMGKIIKLGHGREQAYQEFKRHPEYVDIIGEWIETRIVGRDVNTILDQLQNYMNDKLDEIAESSQDSLAKQAKLEQKEIKKYIKRAKRESWLGFN